MKTCIKKPIYMQQFCSLNISLFWYSAAYSAAHLHFPFAFTFHEMSLFCCFSVFPWGHSKNWTKLKSKKDLHSLTYWSLFHLPQCHTAPCQPSKKRRGNMFEGVVSGAEADLIFFDAEEKKTCCSDLSKRLSAFGKSLPIKWEYAAHPLSTQWFVSL